MKSSLWTKLRPGLAMETSAKLLKNPIIIIGFREESHQKPTPTRREVCGVCHLGIKKFVVRDLFLL
jgi:hypothetical protein